MKLYYAKRFVRLENGALSLMARPLIEEAGYDFFYMLWMAPTSFLFQAWILLFQQRSWRWSSEDNVHLGVTYGNSQALVQGNSKLIIKQVNGDALKEITLSPCLTAVKKLIRSFSHILTEHICQDRNRHGYALATLASKINVLGEAIVLVRKTLRAIAVDLIPTNPMDEQDGVLPLFRILFNQLQLSL